MFLCKVPNIESVLSGPLVSKLVRAVLKIGPFHFVCYTPTLAKLPFPDDVIIAGQAED